MHLQNKKSYCRTYKLRTFVKPLNLVSYRNEKSNKPTKTRAGYQAGLSKSAIEQRFEEHPQLTNREQRYTGLRDCYNTSFNFKIDAYVPALNLAVEFKAHPLNSKKSIETALNKLLAQAKYRNLISRNDQPEITQQAHDKLSCMLWRKGYQKDCLDHAWNHSIGKHRIVSNYFSGQYLVVFENSVKFDSDRLKRRGITAVHERTFNKALDMLSETQDTEAARRLLGLPNIH